MITTEIKVERYEWKRRGREAYGYVEDQGCFQLLVKRWKWRGITLWKRVLGREKVPLNVIISIGALGFYTGPWRSKFAEYMR